MCWAMAMTPSKAEVGRHLALSKVHFCLLNYWTRLRSTQSAISYFGSTMNQSLFKNLFWDLNVSDYSITNETIKVERKPLKSQMLEVGRQHQLDQKRQQQRPQTKKGKRPHVFASLFKSLLFQILHQSGLSDAWHC